MLYALVNTFYFYLKNFIYYESNLNKTEYELHFNIDIWGLLIYC